jgi:hypothetical protein
MTPIIVVVGLLVAAAATAWAGEEPGAPASPPPSTMKFEHQYIDTELPPISNYGHSVLVDIDRDGRPDFVLGRNGKGGTLYWYENQGAGKWARHVLGHDSASDVGAVALDLDGDGWPDLVTSGVWYRHPAKPREQEFTRHVFDPDGGGAHDVLATDLDGDGKPEIITYSSAKGLCWYKVPADPTQPWPKQRIGPGVHGAIAPAAVGDIAGNGHADIVAADTWYENKDGKGTQWVAHKNIPFGRAGPFGVCVRCAVVDIDGDGHKELVMADCDIVGSKVAILKNADGKGTSWSRQDLPMSFTYGSLHSLAVADFNNDGRLDILSNEQEELLPPGRQNPRWVIWENLGNGRFAERIILDAKLGGHELVAGDVDGDGRIDILSKPWGTLPWNALGGKMHVDLLKNLGPMPNRRDK